MLQREIKNLFDTLGEFTKRKDWYNFRCPFHKGDSLKFGINLCTGRYHCFVCGEGGSLFDLLRKLKEGTLSVSKDINGLLTRIYFSEYEEDTSPALLKRLNKGELTPSGRSTEFKHLNRVTPVYFRNKFQYIQDMPNTVGRKHAIKYMKDRGVDYTDKIAGMLDEYAGRIIFPFVKDDEIVYFQARSFVNIPLKTLNPDEENEWLPRSDVIWGYDGIKEDESDIVCLTEGIFDAYSVWKCVNIHSIPLLGKNIGDKQIDLLHELNIKNIIVFLDGDAMPEAIKLAILLYNRKFNVRLVTWKSVILPAYPDPNNVGNNVIKRLILESVEITPQSEILLSLEYV